VRVHLRLAWFDRNLATCLKWRCFNGIYVKPLGKIPKHPSEGDPCATHRYQARRNERDAALRAQLKEIAALRMRFG